MKRILNGPYGDRIYAALVMVTVFLYLLMSTPFKEYPACFASYDFQLDFLEYHMIAINFVRTGDFFIHGIVGDLSVYNLCDNPQTETILSFLKDNGPFVMLNRPPVYVLFLSVIYALFGIETYPIYISNIILVSMTSGLLYLTMSSLPVSGKRLLGLVVAYLFLYYKQPDMLHIDAELLSGFVCALIFYFGIRCFLYNSSRSYFMLGLVVIIGILTKGIFLFLLPLFFIISLLAGRQFREVFIQACWSLLGVAMVLIPWVIFINIHNIRSVEERNLSQEKILNWIPPHTFQNEEAISAFYRQEGGPEEMLKMIIGYAYYLYMESSSFILITNQAASESIFMANNEFCTDGDWHLEWKFIGDSYHNVHHLDKSVPVRVLLFYAENPDLFVRIFASKLISASGLLPSFFWIGAALLGIYMLLLRFGHNIRMVYACFVLSVIVFFLGIYAPAYLYPFLPCLLLLVGLILFVQRRTPAVPVIIPAMYINCIVVILMIYGDERFMEAYNCLGIVSTIYFTWSISAKFWQAVQLRKV